MQVTLYTRRNCSLCDKAKEAISKSGVRIEIAEVDIDADEDLRRQYTNDVPVIFIDGREAFRHRVDPAEFAAYVKGARMSSTLANEKCVPCRGGVPAIKGDELQALAYYGPVSAGRAVSPRVRDLMGPRCLNGATHVFVS